MSNQRSVRWIALELLAVSFVVLFQELALIRWLPGQVRVLAYFPNLILISAFLGLGLGSMRANKASLLWLWAPALLLVQVAAWSVSNVAFTARSTSEHLWLLYHDLPPGSPVVDGVHAPIVMAFVLSALTFVPLGQFLGQRLAEFKKRSTALWGYSWDLTGSLLGVVCFAIAGFAGTTPVFWFGVVLAVGLVVVSSRKVVTGAFVVLGLAGLAMVHHAERAEVYTPYYALKTVRTDRNPGIAVLTNGSLHQIAVPAKRSDRLPQASAANPTRQQIQDIQAHAVTLHGYHLPYRLMPTAPKRGLVLGAGTGNDVAVMLDEGIETVTAVEIDPVILQLGRDHHPNKPYSDARVTAVNDDARSFLNHTDQTFDLIVFGTLDSMTRLSALSNVRLDNFVYTLDCLRAAKARLADGGGIALYFQVGENGFIHDRLIAMLAVVFPDSPPRVARADTGHFNRIFLGGPAFAIPSPKVQIVSAAEIEDTRGRLELPSDDWPYLYLVERGVSGFYMTLIAIFLLLAFVGAAIASPGMRRSLLTGKGIDMEMALFGLAFLLIETRGVTAMNLVWGATWLTSAVVFGSILVMVLLGTVAMQLKPISWHISIAGLVLSLVLSWLVPQESLLGLSTVPRLLGSMVLIGLPILFASICFALRFADRKNPELAFGWNMLGAVVGGLIEFLSMAVGLRALLVVGLVAYLGVALLRERAVAAEAQAPS